MKSTILALLVFFSITSYAQEKFMLSGYVRDEKSSDSIVGASVSIESVNMKVLTNHVGFYSLYLPAGAYSIIVRSPEHSTLTMQVEVSKNTSLTIKMIENITEFSGVSVASKNKSANVKNVETGVSRLNIKQIQKIPAFMGEVDIVKSLQTLPGVTSVGEGASGFNVRGGNIDQNLILMDDAPIFNSSHLFGMFSIFNPDAVKDLTLMKGSIPAQYGGRASSVLDVRIKEGNAKKLEVNGGIGTIFSRLSVEAPILKDKMTFIVSARRSYIDIVSRPFVKGDLKGNKFNFYDLNSKINWRIDKKNTIFLSGYLGRDIFGSDFKFNYGNSLATIGWNHKYNSRLSAKTTAFYSNYKYFLSFDFNSVKFDWNSNIINYSAKTDYTYAFNASNTFKFGAQSIYYTFKPGNGRYTESDFSTDINLPAQHALENAIYISNEQKLSNKLNVLYGLRWSFYNYIGKGTAYIYSDTSLNTRKPLKGEINYNHLENIKSYNVPEPRLALNYTFNKKQSIKLSYTRAAQYLQIVSNTAASTPLDIYAPATNNIKPLISDQGSVGYYRNFKENAFETSAEVYYKQYENQLDFIDNSNFYLNKYLEADLLQGKGRAYGLELYAKKNSGKLTGWISYSLSKTERKVDGISNSEWFLSKYDRTHNVSAVVMYDMTKRLTLSGNFTYLSGTPATFPDSKMEVQGFYFPNNTANKRGNYRISSYNRLDLGLTYNFKGNERRKTKSTLVISLYNAYGRRNAFSVYFRNNPTSVSTIDNEAIRYSVIGTVVPAITYNFKF